MDLFHYFSFDLFSQFYTQGSDQRMNELANLDSYLTNEGWGVPQYEAPIDEEDKDESF